MIGSPFTINRVPYTLVGVAPPGFYGDTLRSDPPDFWLPLATEPALSRQKTLLNHPEVYWLYCIGRLTPGGEPAHAESKLTIEVQQWLNGQAGQKEISKAHVRLMPAGGGVAQMQTDYAAGLRLAVVAHIVSNPAPGDIGTPRPEVLSSVMFSFRAPARGRNSRGSYRGREGIG